MSLTFIYVTSCENGAYGLRHLVGAGFRPAQVITISPAVAARARVSGYSDLRSACAEWGLDLKVLDSYAITTSDLTVDSPDLLVVNGWNRLIDATVIARCRLGGLGLHAGHPPIGLGRAPLPWSLIKGMRDLEVYVFRLTATADDGDIVDKQTVEITPFDDVRLLYEKVMYRGAFLFESALRAARAGTLRGVPQNLADAVHYPKRTPEDGRIDFAAPLQTIVDFVRAQSRPYPGAFTHLGDETWHIWRAIPFDAFAFRDQLRRPGEILAALPAGLVVQTGTAPLWVLDATVADTIRVPASLDELETWVGHRFRGEAA